MARHYAANADEVRKQRLAIAQIRTEEWLEAQPGGVRDLYGVGAVQAFHRHLFEQLPEPDRRIEDGSLVEPGVLRTRNVSVGRHAAPEHGAIAAMLERWAQVYGGTRRGEMQVVAAAASHHRLAWIHPFIDGNGRVARLHTHGLLRRLALSNGLWSPLRGFARTHQDYYERLAAADEPRAGDLDGRGTLSERGLVQWIEYTLSTSLDQVRFMSALLRLDGIKDRIAACLACEAEADLAAR